MGDHVRGVNTVTLVYFSGTGGTKAAAEAFADCFSRSLPKESKLWQGVWDYLNE